ncbi:MAG: hypothetical protein ACRDP6_07360 [Actinoallomurus sp.]
MKIMNWYAEEYVRERMQSRLSEARQERRAAHVVRLRRAESRARKARTRLAVMKLRSA